MVSIAMARVMVDFVERSGAEHRSPQDAKMAEAASGRLWSWLQRMVGGFTARAEVRPGV